MSGEKDLIIVQPKSYETTPLTTSGNSSEESCGNCFRLFECAPPPDGDDPNESCCSKFYNS
jgi:hypothetical protein